MSLILAGRFGHIGLRFESRTQALRLRLRLEHMQSGASGRVLEPMVQYSKFYLYGLISIAFEGILGLDR